ncbi:hypothetical protein [Methylibium petroleiphilum]|uniref:hypothetical protein n=1 Tax=Methylibium petroleiphilum TaxID=105560 RepID=UPI003D2B2317
MRLSELAAERGIDSFQFEDFLFVSGPLKQDPARLVLVGGQAIETWGHYFHVLPPTGDHVPLTEDTDFLGSANDARWLCKLLGRADTELILAKNFDPSPNAAIAYIKRPDGRILMIDFLRAIVGVNNADITSMAVRVEIAGNVIHVLHPLLCLKSRLANLATLASKRNTNGVMQAHWAIDIVRAYLVSLLGRGATQRELIKQFSVVSEIAEFGSGPYCFKHYKIDPLTAISAEMVERVGSRFVTEDWPRRLARIEEKRKRFAQQIMKFNLSDVAPNQTIPNIGAGLLRQLPSKT